MSLTYAYSPEAPPKQEPPPRRAEVLAFIKGEIAQGRPFPSPDAIRVHMGWRKTGSVSHALEALRSIDGQVRIKGGRWARPRVWELVD